MVDPGANIILTINIYTNGPNFSANIGKYFSCPIYVSLAQPQFFIFYRPNPASNLLALPSWIRWT
jgi:hypothetical protein